MRVVEGVRVGLDESDAVDVRERVGLEERDWLAESVAVDVRERVGLEVPVFERERVEDADGGSGYDT